MSKLRSVSTAFWSDPFIEELNPNEKLLFLYFITNEKTNMLGIYEVSIKKISYDTGMNKEVIEDALKEFETLKKVKYINNHVILVNFIKHQNYNPNMKKSAIDVYNDLPNCLKDSDLIIDKSDVIKGFETLIKALGLVSKVEDEVEDEKNLILLDTKHELFLKDCLESYTWIESISMREKIPEEKIELALKDFNGHLLTTGQNHLSLKDYKYHFVMWVKKRKEASK